MIEEQSREIQEMQGEFNNASTLLNEKYQMMSDRFDAIQELYE